MRLSLPSLGDEGAWQGYHLPQYDPAEIAENTRREPRWLHFGAGNIFRIFPAALCQQLIELQQMDTGIVCCEGYDEEIITRCFRPYDNLTIGVTLYADGEMKKEVIGSVTESLTMKHDSRRVRKIFCSPTLQMVSFTITEKGYSLRGTERDRQNGPADCDTFLAQLTAMCLERKKTCGAPLALVSMDNCSHNGERLQNAVMSIAQAWLERKKIDALGNDIAFPWTMIDKITPRPDPAVEARLAADGLEDIKVFVTESTLILRPLLTRKKHSIL